MHNSKRMEVLQSKNLQHNINCLKEVGQNWKNMYGLQQQKPMEKNMHAMIFNWPVLLYMYELHLPQGNQHSGAESKDHLRWGIP